jgi:hypothetical protein
MSKDIRQRLEEAIASLSPTEHRTLRILTEAILEIHKDTAAMRRDVELLHNKIQPVLKSLSEEGKIQVFSGKFDGRS